MGTRGSTGEHLDVTGSRKRPMWSLMEVLRLTRLS